LLIQHFLDAACARAGRRKELSAEALDALLAHHWPGNVRELRNTIDRVVASSRGSLIEASDLSDMVAAAGPPSSDRPFADLPTLDDLERRYLQHVLGVVNWNRTRAAEILGVDRRTLYRMAERFGIGLKD
jgi:DNA-binding NtrC family response regulator